MIEKLDSIILITYRIYELYIDLMNLELSPGEKQLQIVKEKLNLCLEVEQNFYNNLNLDKDKFIELLNLLNVDNNALLSIPYYYGEEGIILKSSLLLEMVYIYNFLFFNKDKMLNDSINYHELLSKTYTHPILRRIVFSLYQTYYHSEKYEPFVHNDLLQYINFDYINRGYNIVIGRKNYNFMEELFLESISKFTLEVLIDMKNKMDKNDKFLYVYMKYILCFINRNTEKKLLNSDSMLIDKVEIPQIKYNTGTTELFNFYTYIIAIKNLLIMLEEIFNDEEYNDEIMENFSYKMIESIIDACFNIFSDDVKRGLLEELNKLNEQIDNLEYKKIIDKINKNKQYIHK